ncbi:MAG: hypothetical protein HY551_05100, partial [Elusimicrobia bacterium]|nr:hypothetical protein [Elusimicrobiota bacterium]
MKPVKLIALSMSFALVATAPGLGSYQAWAAVAEVQLRISPVGKAPAGMFAGNMALPIGEAFLYEAGYTDFNPTRFSLLTPEIGVKPVDTVGTYRVAVANLNSVVRPAISFYPARALTPAVGNSVAAMPTQGRTVVGVLATGVGLVKQAVVAGNLPEAGTQIQAIFGEGSRRMNLQASDGSVVPSDEGGSGNLGGAGNGGSGGNPGGGGEGGGQRYPDPRTHFSVALDAARAIGPNPSLIHARF